MSRSIVVTTSLVWAGVWAFWFVTTESHHPTRTLALIVTTCLVVAYAVAAYLNHLVLIPRYWRSRRFGRYAGWLGLSMILLTAAALTLIRVAYFRLWGPDADPNGAVKHFAIDLFGMAVHLIAVAVVVAGMRWIRGHGRHP